MNSSFKRLEPVIRNHGYTMRLIKRTDDVAMYSKAGGFEVIRVRRHPGGELFGKTLEPYELYPGDEQFGRMGWFFAGPKGRERADEKYDALVAQVQAKKAKPEVSEVIGGLVAD